MDSLKNFYGPNAGYVLELYERYKQDPSSVDAETRALFAHWSPETYEPSEGQGQATAPTNTGTGTGTLPFQGQAIAPVDTVPFQEIPAAFSRSQVRQIVAATALATGIRKRGHLGAHIDPLGSEPLGDRALQPETYGITNADLAALSPAVIGGHSAEGAKNALEAVQSLRAMYSGTISYEFDQVQSAEERSWLRDTVGLRLYHRKPSVADTRKLLK